ncbi:hypothetical protein CC79DRAFT_1320014 [Sarocladium strictum]
MAILKQNPDVNPSDSDTESPMTVQQTCDSEHPRGFEEWGTELKHTNKERAAACKIAYAWDLSLLDIDPQNPPTVDSLRQTLLSILEDRLKTVKACEHVPKGRHLVHFIQQGICSCFTHPGQYIHPFSEDSRDDCYCMRRRDLTCNDCGAVYAWYLAAGHVMLLHRYVWNVHMPTSPAWYALLDQDSYQDRFLGRQLAMCFGAIPRVVQAATDDDSRLGSRNGRTLEQDIH